ncbi:MAG: hypothetical protein R6X02_01625 [Enhygromyxa sp.]
MAATTGCPSGPGGEGGEDGTDEGSEQPPQGCEEPGTPLFEGAKVVELPGPNAQPVSCGSGWATDAPQLDPSWTVELPVSSSQFGFLAMFIDAHPDGGVVVAATGLFARYDGDGELLWSLPGEIGDQTNIVMAVEEAGTIILAVYNWSDDSGTVDRYDADGMLIETVAIPFNSPNGNVWGLATEGSELIVGAMDLDAQGSWKTTLLRLDAGGELLLRKATNMTSAGQLAVNGNGSVVFGSFPTFIVSLDNGAVLGQLAPSLGQPSRVAGFDNDYVMAGTAAGDFAVGRYSEAGVERWLQTYDRAGLVDAGRAIDVGPEGSIVAVGATALLDFNDIFWFGTQPWIVGVDGDGEALWSDRIAAVGDATAVSIAGGGEVYVAGGAEGLREGDSEPPMLAWLRRYDP